MTVAERKKPERKQSSEIPHPLNTYGEPVHEAYFFAQEAHGDQTRYTGDLHFDGHSVPVAIMYHNLGLNDEVAVVAALLHDVTEDTEVDIEKIREKFGDEVAGLVDPVTKFGSKKSDGDIPKEKIDKETLRTIFSEGYADVRIFILKLIDRRHNMSEFEPVPDDKKRGKAEETLTYAGLARQIGAWEWMVELQDAAFPYVYPEEYEWVQEQFDKDERVKQEFIDTVEEKLQQIIVGSDIENSRVKSDINGKYAILQKYMDLVYQGKSPEGIRDINDVVSFRMLVETEAECVELEKAVIEAFGDDIVEGERDDYLENPQPNGYSVIALTVQTKHGPIEIAITTHEKEEVNNEGVVAYLRRKEEPPENLFKVKVVFDQEGDVFFVPQRARAVDVIYALYPYSAHRISGLRVNGNVIGLEDVVENAVDVEPVTSEESMLEEHRAALEFSLPETKKAVETLEKVVDTERLIAKGKTLLETELAPRGFLEIDDLPKGPESARNRIINMLQRKGLVTAQDIFRAIGEDESGQILSQIKDILDDKQVEKEHHRRTTVSLSGKNAALKDKIHAGVKNLDGDIIREVSDVDENDNFVWKMSIKWPKESGDLATLEEQLFELFSKQKPIENIIIADFENEEDERKTGSEE